MTTPADALEPQDRDIPPLAGGVRCTDCGGSSHSRPHTVVVPKAEVWQALSRTYENVAQLGGLKEIRTVSATAWGRPVKVGIYGPSGGDTQIRADDLRLVLLRNHVSGAGELKSMFCTIRDDGRNLVFENVRGYGHGVGMCQFGAQGKALRGLNCRQILASYYPQSRIHKAY
jgi:stage II sporulation protein D